MYQGDTFLLLSAESTEAETFSLGWCLFSQCCAAGDNSCIKSVAKAEENKTPPGHARVQCITVANSEIVCDLSLAHTYTSLEPETGHTVEFYHTARVDGLWKRFETATEMTEYFMGREDFLHMRHIEFGERDLGVEMAGVTAEANARPIVVWPRQEQKICVSVIFKLCKTYCLELQFIFSGHGWGWCLQMRHPSVVQLLCLTVASLTESYSVSSCQELYWAARIKLGN